jgi:tetratricopeptide (TPR) repeat protein
MTTTVRLVSLALVPALALLACGSSHRSPTTAESQLRFGVDMAKRGLWSEAFFRFQQAQRLQGGADPKVLNNLAVASEALGKFDQALDYYKQALQLAPGDPEAKANYDRFVSFYESFRARGEDKEGKAVPATPATESRPAAPRPTAPEPPAAPPPPGPAGAEPPDIPPLTPPEPAPTPPAGGFSHA